MDFEILIISPKSTASKVTFLGREAFRCGRFGNNWLSPQTRPLSEKRTVSLSPRSLYHSFWGTRFRKKRTFQKNKVKQSRYTPWRHLGGEEVSLLLIHDLGTRWGWVVSITPWPRFAPGERTPGKLGGPQSRSGHRCYRKKSFAPAGDRTPIARSSSP
jgi:hypothetical protein